MKKMKGTDAINITENISEKTKEIRKINYKEFYESIIKINLNNQGDKIFEPIKQNFVKKNFKYKIIGFYGSKIKGKTILLSRLLKQYENFEYFQKYNSSKF